MHFISSKDNPLFKKIVKLEKSRERKKTSLFVIEGKKEVLMAIQNGYEITDLVVVENVLLRNSEVKILEKIPNKVTFATSLFNQIAYRKELSECVAIAKIPNVDLESIKLSDKPLVVVLESVEKPGNLGAILRTADACAADAVIVCDALSDFFNPNVIRSSVGTVFCVNKASAEKEDVKIWLEKNGFTVYTTFIENAKPYHQADFSGPNAIVLGTEAEGLTNFWRNPAHQNIVIPMRGQNDSLNVSVAAAIIMMEARKHQ
jgi:TrmH family RNA methyltransferase